MTTEINPKAAELRAKLLDAKAAHLRGKITAEQLHAIADEYIAFLKDYRKRSGKKFSIPSRAYLIRAI